MVTKVPYEFDGNTVGTLVAPSQFFGQHGYLPEDVDLAHNINMHATFVAGGPDIAHAPSVAGVRAVDLAPTLAVLGGFNPPLQAQGRVLTSILKGGSRYATGQLLAINDVHGNLTGNGLTYTDPYTGVKDAAGGIATLADVPEAGASDRPRNTVTVEAGDMVGASPPESGAAARQADPGRAQPDGHRRRHARQPRVRPRRARRCSSRSTAGSPPSTRRSPSTG